MIQTPNFIIQQKINKYFPMSWTRTLGSGVAW